MKEKLGWINKKILCVMVILAVLGIAIGGVFVSLQIKKAPKLSDISLVPEGYLTTILDEDENVVDTLYTTESNRIYVPIDEISIYTQEAFVAIEDARYYSHHGIDIRGIVRAFIKGVCKGRFSQGASTITQQLIKNNVLTSWVSETSFYERVCRKIQEQYLAVKVESAHTKEEILEYYLNTINLGSGTRGVQVAAQYYFDKNVSDLSIAESALIAGITKNPSRYNPVNHPEKSIERQRMVLDAMLQVGYINQNEYDDAINEDVISRVTGNSHTKDNPVFSWFEDALIESVVTDLQNQYDYSAEEAWDVLYSGGLKVFSSLDTNAQGICEAVAMDSSYYSDNEEISIVIMDPATGAVKAIIGGRGEKKECLSYNRAIEAVRQPGSTLKILGEYATAIDSGTATLGTVIDDAPYTYTDGSPIHNAYKEYPGKTTLHKAIANSSNIVALKTFQNIGLDKTNMYLQSFGLKHLDANDKFESLALGGTYGGVTNLELTSAYNAISNDGIYNTAFFYTKVTDSMGNVILENHPDKKRIIKASTAELLTVAMEDVIKEGTGKLAGFDNMSIAGKSGTTNDYKDGWFVGYSPYYTCGVWGGHDDCASQASTDYVKVIWREVMQSLHVDKENLAFAREQLAEACICSKCGKLARTGICENSCQGDVTCSEYYANGTIPTDLCDCHVMIEICKDSGLRKGVYCPANGCVKKVYLAEASKNTEDYGYVYPSSICNKHQKEYHLPDVHDSEDKPNDKQTIFDKLTDWYHKFLN